MIIENAPKHLEDKLRQIIISQMVAELSKNMQHLSDIGDAMRCLFEGGFGGASISALGEQAYKIATAKPQPTNNHYTVMVMQ